MDLVTLLPVFVVALVLIAAGVLAMAVGVIFRRPCLRGSCGGPDVTGPDGKSLSCASCPNRRAQQGVASVDRGFVVPAEAGTQRLPMYPTTLDGRSSKPRR